MSDTPLHDRLRLVNCDRPRTPYRGARNSGTFIRFSVFTAVTTADSTAIAVGQGAQRETTERENSFRFYVPCTTSLVATTWLPAYVRITSQSGCSSLVAGATIC